MQFFFWTDFTNTYRYVDVGLAPPVCTVLYVFYLRKLARPSASAAVASASPVVPKFSIRPRSSLLHTAWQFSLSEHHRAHVATSLILWNINMEDYMTRTLPSKIRPPPGFKPNSNQNNSTSSSSSVTTGVVGINTNLAELQGTAYVLVQLSKAVLSLRVISKKNKS